MEWQSGKGNGRSEAKGRRGGAIEGESEYLYFHLITRKTGGIMLIRKSMVSVSLIMLSKKIIVDRMITILVLLI